MRGSLRTQVVAWLVCCVALVVLLVVQAAALRAGFLDEDDAAVIGCCVYPMGFVGLAVWGGLLWQHWDREQRTRERALAHVLGRCWGCGYDTTGLEGRCPECGRPLPTAAWTTDEGSEQIQKRGRKHAWTARRQGVAWLATFLLLVVLVVGLSLAGFDEPPGTDEPVVGLFCCMFPFVGGAMLAWGAWIVWHWEDNGM